MKILDSHVIVHSANTPSWILSAMEDSKSTAATHVDEQTALHVEEHVAVSAPPEKVFTLPLTIAIISLSVSMNCGGNDVKSD